MTSKAKKRMCHTLASGLYVIVALSNSHPSAAQASSPECRNKLSNGAPANSDFNNNTTFERARIHRHRGIIGLNYKYDILYLAGQVAFDLVAPGAENPDVIKTRQYTVSTEAGVSF